MTESMKLFPFLVAEIDNANSAIFGLIMMAGFFLAVIGAIILFLVLHEKVIREVGGGFPLGETKRQWAGPPVLSSDEEPGNQGRHKGRP